MISPATFDYTQHTYTLMHKDGVYQWRWIPPLPEGVSDDAVSPPFSTREEARKWQNERMTNSAVSIKGWKPVDYA